MLGVLVNNNIDTVMAVGGGSVIDAAKGMILFALETYKIKNISKNKPFFIAVPTTSGTGSEVTNYSVLTDTINHRKLPLISKDMMPDIAILDPDFTITVPPRITAETGMDVMTHALESYVALNSSNFTRPYSRTAIELVFKHLKNVYDDGKNIKGRIAMHEASCIAGIAFNTAGLGLVHAMAHSLGATFKQPHGRSNAVILPHVVILNGSKCKVVAKRYTDIVKSLGFNPKNNNEGVIILSEAIKVLNKNVGISSSMQDYGIDKSQFNNQINHMAELALKDLTLTTNPVPIAKEEVINIYRAVI